jgi:hypothetical protein
MQIKGFIEIADGLWYEEATGFGWSNRYQGIRNKYNLKKLKIGEDGYTNTKIDHKTVKWHRLVYEYFIGEIPNDMCVDHINNDRRNNKFTNLKLFTHKENCRKRLKGNNNTSGYVGVTWDSYSNKWRAEIMVNGNALRLGRFNDPKEAYQAYIAAKIKYHGIDSISPLEGV